MALSVSALLWLKLSCRSTRRSINLFVCVAGPPTVNLNHRNARTPSRHRGGHPNTNQVSTLLFTMLKGRLTPNKYSQITIRRPLPPQMTRTAPPRWGCPSGPAMPHKCQVSISVIRIAEPTQKPPPTTGSGRVNPCPVWMAASPQGQVQACIDDSGGSQDVSPLYSTAISVYSQVPSQRNLTGGAPARQVQLHTQGACTAPRGDPGGRKDPPHTVPTHLM
jgi:hypothetical protein